MKTFPTFSSDGSRIAYVWKPDQEDSGIFLLRTIGQSTPPVRLTHEGISPAWSTDGSQMALVRRSIKARPSPGLMLYSFTTTQSSEIGDLDRQMSIGLSVSPAGRWLAFSGPARADPPSQDVMLIENFRK